MSRRKRLLTTSGAVKASSLPAQPGSRRRAFQSSRRVLTVNSSKTADANDASELRQELAHHNYRYYVLDSPEISDAAVRPADAGAAGARGGVPRARHARTRPPSAWAAPRPRSSRRWSTARPMLSLANVFNDEELSEFDERIRKQSGARAGRLRLRAQAGRPGDHAALRARRASSRAPRAATAPRARTSPRTCAPCAACPLELLPQDGVRCPSCSRCAARSSSARRTSRSSTRSARRRASRSSPTRATPPPAACASWTRRITAARPLSHLPLRVRAGRGRARLRARTRRSWSTSSRSGCR